ETYEQDQSALGRLGAWRFAINLAHDRPLMGGGFDVFNPEAFQRWAPDVRFQDSHSIWFQVLAMHGYVGLGIYLLLWWLAWGGATDIIPRCKTPVHSRWGT